MISWKKIFIFGLMLSFSMLVLKQGDPVYLVFAQSPPSENASFEETYQAGAGLPLGKIQSVEGEVVIFHADMTTGYLAQTGLPLFKMDTIDVRETGRIGCKLGDGSIFFLAPATKLVIDKSSYNSSLKISRSTMSLVYGKAYFHVKRWDEFEPREFKVRAESVLASTKDSRFIVEADQKATRITVVGKGSLTITSLANRDNQLILSEFEQAFVEGGVLPASVETLQDEQIRRLKAEFRHVTQLIPNQ